ncbi:MAG: glycosyl transferase, partial [Actinobacteria bacterium]
QPALLACRANWVDGREHPMNVPRQRPLVSQRLECAASSVHAMQIRTASFVAILIDTRAIREDGLPIADYFLWNDDFEYTARLLRHRIGLYVPSAIVEHCTKVFGNSTADPGPRFLNEVRNKIWVFSRSEALSPLEKTLYGGKTVLRWGAMLVQSASRGKMLKYFRQGVMQGILPPRPTEDVLADTPVALDVVRVEGEARRE